MKRIKIIALVAALVLGFCMYKYLGILNQEKEAPRTNVVVCAVDIPQNTTITAEMVTMKALLSESVLPDAVTDLNSVVGMVMNSDMYAGEQVLSSRLVRLGDANTTSDSLAYVIEPGMRAATINVSINSGLANMLRPGNHVDVVAYYTIKEEERIKGYNGVETVEIKETPVATLLMQDIEILAVDTTIRKGAADVDGYGTVTLELTPEQAIKISFTEQYYGLRLILRSTMDEEQAVVADVLLDSLVTQG